MSYVNVTVTTVAYLIGLDGWLGDTPKYFINKIRLLLILEER